MKNILHKNRNRRVLILFFLSIVTAALLSSCAFFRKAGNNAPQPAVSPVAVARNTTDLPEGEPLHVFLPGFNYKALTFESVDYINVRLAEFEFNMAFDHYHHTGIYYDTPAYYDAYADFAKRNVDRNAAYIDDIIVMQRMAAEVDFGDFMETAEYFAPEYVKKAEIFANKLNGRDGLVLFPPGLTRANAGDLMVIIRKELADAYKTEVRTAGELKKILEWLKADDPESVPAMSLVFSPEAVLDIFLPESGYYNPNQPGVFIQNETDKTLLAYYGDEAVSAFAELAEWQRLGLIYPATHMNRGQMGDLAFDKYKALILYADEFINMETNYVDITAKYDMNKFDASGYTAYVLYNDGRPEVDYGIYYSRFAAAAGKGADLSELFRFLQWLEKRENYIAFFYGKEGEDYKLENGRVTPLDTGVNMRKVREALLPLNNPDYEPVPVSAPHNYEAEMSAISRPYTLKLSPYGAEASFPFHKYSDAFWHGNETLLFLSNEFFKLYSRMYDPRPENGSAFAVATEAQVLEIIEKYKDNVREREAEIIELKSGFFDAVAEAEKK